MCQQTNAKTECNTEYSGYSLLQGGLYNKMQTSEGYFKLFAAQKKIRKTVQQKMFSKLYKKCD